MDRVIIRHMIVIFVQYSKKGSFMVAVDTPNKLIHLTLRSAGDSGV